jgi:UDP-glucose 4-epimerase
MKRAGVLLLGGGGFIGSVLVNRLKQEKVRVHIVDRHDMEQLGRLLPQCGTVYGNPDRLPVTEDAFIAPLSSYGAGKASQEAFCHRLHMHGQAATILRPSNACGPGQQIKSGFGLLRTMLEHIHLGTTMEIWGDGKIIRDFIYIADIADIADATVGLVKLPHDAGTYNLGSGGSFSINEIRNIVETVSGKALQTIYRPARGMDVRRVILGNSRLSARLGWQPSVGLMDGVARTQDWLLQG